MKTLLEVPAFIYGWGCFGYTLYYLFRYRDKSQDWRVSLIPAVFAALAWPYRLYLRLNAANGGRDQSGGARSPAPTRAAPPAAPGGPAASEPGVPRTRSRPPSPGAAVRSRPTGEGAEHDRRSGPLR